MCNLIVSNSHKTFINYVSFVPFQQEALRKNWMFKLVGRETFAIGKMKATINIDASGGFSYEYTLDVGGKSLKKFVEQRSKTAKVWCTSFGGIDYRIVLGEFTSSPSPNVINESKPLVYVFF